MNQQEQKQLAWERSALSVFRGILKHTAMDALLRFLDSEENTRQKLASYGEFVNALSGDKCSLSDFLCRAVYEDENAYVVGTAKKSWLERVMKKKVENLGDLMNLASLVRASTP